MSPDPTAVALAKETGRRYNDARLMALAPDLAVWASDAADWMGSVHEAALANREPDYEEMDALLARFRQLEERAG